MVGWTDVPVDLKDTKRLDRLREYLPKIGRVVSSDLQRAIKTADALCLPQIRLPHQKDLRELNFGDWEMKTVKEISATFNDRLISFYENPGKTSAPNGESWNQLCDRANMAVDRLLLQKSNLPLVIVAHFGIILSQIQRAEGKGAKHTMRHKIDNFSLTHLKCHEKKWRINKINFFP